MKVMFSSVGWGGLMEDMTLMPSQHPTVPHVPQI
jgi:hypothetical protein